MESTGVFWRPVYHLLDVETRTLVLVNPQQIKAVPGRKTDMKDSERIAKGCRMAGRLAAPRLSAAQLHPTRPDP